MFDVEGYVHEAWALWRGSAFSSPIVDPPQPQAWLQSCASLMDMGSSLPCTANLPREFLWEITTWHSIRATSSHLLIRETQAQVFACCFKRLPPLPPPPSLLPAFFSCTCIRICIFQVYVLVKWKEKRKSPKFKNKHCSEPSLRKTQNAILRIAFTQGHISYLKYIFSQKGAPMDEELSGSFLV